MNNPITVEQAKLLVREGEGLRLELIADLFFRLDKVERIGMSKEGA